MAGETRQKILQATEQLIVLKGMARVTTKEIAREANLSEGALYRHFEHKEEVFFAILSKYLPGFLATLQTHLAGTGTVQDNLEALVLAATEYYGHLLPMIASFFADHELLTRYQALLQQVEGGPEKFFEVVAAYIEEEQQLGRIEQQTSALQIAIELLGPCFQYKFLQQLTNDLPFGQTDQEFVKNFVQGWVVHHCPSE